MMDWKTKFAGLPKLIYTLNRNLIRIPVVFVKKQQAGPKVSVEMRSTNSENDLKMQEKGWKSKQLGLRLATELVWSGQGGISLIDKEANGTDQGPERDHIW